MSLSTSYLTRLVMVVLLILAIFGLILNGLTEDSFWIDEGYSAWVIRDNMPEPETFREAMRFGINSLFNSFDRCRTDVHPPLYYLLLDVWALTVGGSEFALRSPSALMSLIALAATFAIGRQWFGSRTALIAILMLGTVGFYIYYAREARMYGLYLALATMSTWAYSKWWQNPTSSRLLLYGLISGLMLYTHDTSFTLIVAHFLHALITLKHWSRKANWWQVIVLFALPCGLFSVWIPFFLEQFTINTGFAAAGGLTSSWGTLAAMWLVLTSGYWGIFALVVLLSRNTFKIRHRFSAMCLLLLWGFIPLITLFLINASGFAILQLRYLIPMLPAWSLLVAYLVSDMRIPFIQNRYVSLAVMVFFIGWITYTRLATYHLFWHEKPNWRETVASTSLMREPLEPALVFTHRGSPIDYYDEQFGVFDGVSIRVDWREFAPPEIWDIANALDNAASSWAMVEMQAPESWDAIAALSENRGVGYRASVQGAIFYRFDALSNETLSFMFGTAEDSPILAFQGQFYTRYLADAGDEICVPIVLEALLNLPEPYDLNLTLTRGYNEVVSQSQTAINEVQSGDIIEHTLCVTVPDADDFHLRLIISERQASQSLFLLENGHYWGDYLMLGSVVQNLEE